MGFYINPPDKSKEQFLKDHGTKISLKEAATFDFNSESRVVCLVDNGPFTAAGIAYNKGELDAMTYQDGRPMEYYTVPMKELEPYCPLEVMK